MSLLLLFANQEEVVGGPALDQAAWERLQPRPRIFVYEGRAQIQVIAAGRSSLVAGDPPASAVAPARYRFTGRARLQISEKAATGHHDRWAKARCEDEELLLLE